MHLRVAMERLTGKYGIAVADPRAGGALQGDHPRRDRACAAATRSSRAATASSATSCSTSSRCRAAPASQFAETITGGAVPRNYFGSVEMGVAEYLNKGPLGFPVVDVSVTLTDGSYHAVDSSDMAFRTAAQIGMREGMPQCHPVLLEPILKVEIAVPSEATPRVNGIVSQRRGQILGFDAPAGLARLGRGRGADPAGRDPRPDRRAALGDGRRRHLQVELRSSCRTDRPARRPGHRTGGRKGGLSAWRLKSSGCVRSSGGRARPCWCRCPLNRRRASGTASCAGRRAPLHDWVGRAHC